VEHSNSSRIATWALPDIDQYMAPVAERSSKYATWLDTRLVKFVHHRFTARTMFHQ